jgi:hypothetical protein
VQGDYAEGMNPEQKELEMGYLMRLCGVLRASEVERKQILKGGSILLDLDWTSNYIFGRTICQRAIQGLVPRYEGPWSRTDYEKRWSEDQK